jgi:hypothetical protein
MQNFCLSHFVSWLWSIGSVKTRNATPSVPTLEKFSANFTIQEVDETCIRSAMAIKSLFHLKELLQLIQMLFSSQNILMTTIIINQWVQTIFHPANRPIDFLKSFLYGFFY